MVVNQPYLIRNNKASLYLTRKIPGRVRLGVIQPHSQELGQDPGKDVRGCLRFVLLVLALLIQLDLI